MPKVEDVAVELTQVPNVARFPCPKCGKETKTHHKGTRICSNAGCRHIAGEGTIAEHVPAEELAAKLFACPKCGKATKVHIKGQRHCALCRHVFTPASA